MDGGTVSPCVCHLKELRLNEFPQRMRSPTSLPSACMLDLPVRMTRKTGSKTQLPRRFQFKYLPPEIVLRILSFIPRRGLQDVMFSLFPDPKIQHEMCCKTLNRTLSFTEYPRRQDLLWARELASPEIRELDVTFSKVSVRDRPVLIIQFQSVLSLILQKCSSLRKLSCFTEMLPWISCADTLRDLTLHVHRSEKVLIDCLRTLNLETLNICCDLSEPCGSQPCCETGDRLVGGISGQTRFGEILCPNLRSLSMRCMHRPENTRLFAIMAAFPALTEVTFHCQVPFAYRHRLSNLKTVHLDRTRYDRESSSLQPKRHASEDTLKFASDIGVAVKTIIADSWINRCQMFYLPLCPFLETLHMNVEAGSETTISQLVHDKIWLCKLQRLSLNWFQDVKFFDWDWTSAGSYHQLEPGVLFNIVQGSPSLTHLSLTNVKIPQGELREILCLTGKKLKSFTTTALLQDENVIERLAIVVEAVAQFCTVLGILKVTDRCELEGRHGREQHELMRRLEIGIRRVKLRLPGIDVDSIESCALCIRRHFLNRIAK